VDGGAGVVNVSLVSSQDTPQLDQAVRYALSKGVLVVAASGNDANAGAMYPASIPGVLAVGATAADGSIAQGSEANSNAGVGAPGADIVSVSAASPSNPYLIADNGTSFAAPYVAGTAALILAYRPHLSPAQLIHRIEATADRPTSGFLPDPRIGWGVVNPYRAVTEELPEEQGAGSTAVPQGMKPPSASVAEPDRAAQAATVSIIGAGLVALAVPAVGLAMRSGRRRGWRPGASE
jgi:subtilisin family serine protease